MPNMQCVSVSHNQNYAHEYHLGAVYVGYVVDKQAMGQAFFLSTFITPCQSSFKHCSIFMLIHLPSTLYTLCTDSKTQQTR